MDRPRWSLVDTTKPALISQTNKRGLVTDRERVERGKRVSGVEVLREAAEMERDNAWGDTDTLLVRRR